jgi:hypothetical protein
MGQSHSNLHSNSASVIAQLQSAEKRGKGSRLNLSNQDN